jgi:hypothetical protein
MIMFALCLLPVEGCKHHKEPEPGACTQCHINLCITGVPAGKVVSKADFTLGHGTEEEIAAFIDGSSNSLPLENLMVNVSNQSQLSNLGGFDVGCSDIFTLSGSIYVEDNSCPGFHLRRYSTKNARIIRSVFDNNNCTRTICIDWSELSDLGCF